MSGSTETVAEAVGATLAAAGVRMVFGVLGSGNLVVTNALVAGGARFVAARHEGGAACMADGYARVSGEAGVVTVHQGPGLTNAMTGIAEAVKSRTPLLVLAADTPAAALHSNFRIDQAAMVEAVGAVAVRLSDPSDAVAALRRAAAERRPVVVNLPLDVQRAPAPSMRAALRSSDARKPALIPDAEAVRRVVELLAASERPVIVGGRGAVLSGAGPALAALGERCGALLATSAPAHGLFAGEPFALGIAGGLATPLAQELLPQADLVLAFGAALNHWTTRSGTLFGDAAVVQVDVDEAALGVHGPRAATVVGDAGGVARALIAALDAAAGRAGDLAAGDSGATRGWRTPELARTIARRRWRDEPLDAAVARAGEPPAGRVHPGALTIALDDLLPADRTVALDSGHFLGWPAMYLPVTDPRGWVFANGFQAVGLGLGCAIGAALARPDRITVAALGDGGCFMALPELESTARLALKLLVVVYDDAAYGAEVHHFAPSGQDVSGAQFPDADVAALGRAAGAEAVTVRDLGDLAAVERWLAAGAPGPLVLDAKVDPTICAAWLEDAFRGG
ncbi:thiamine pyrophosphate-binding protein [Conexibacter stalactiti]|uniref:Thiamine pyrophosphate-binding protein n=1 Tax=Conexibacter stalactiti TaxID=1940611 RepID=A0ABU4HNC7_9ACTN|nr:thiamine pyrophosphate-binding protein [Conexibacter stalactiti]MDW5594812.1 thiamine pyrophosphate-binding protein [Conexibacter stalactiti]MEC5035454.1 thiamine pyrophosphate-binding protein [Conexibacter stalactiti]